MVWVFKFELLLTYVTTVFIYFLIVHLCLQKPFLFKPGTRAHV